LNSTLIDGQNWMAAFEKPGGRPGRRSCGACQVILSSGKVNSDPRLRGAALYVDQFVVRWRADAGFVMPPV
jgi:hypothetical protein